MPRPEFSPSNPYWQPLRITGLNSKVQPTLNWHDFLYASMWEMQSRDNHGAYCVRTAVQLGTRLSFRQSIQNQIKDVLLHDKACKAKRLPMVLNSLDDEHLECKAGDTLSNG